MPILCDLSGDSLYHITTDGTRASGWTSVYANASSPSPTNEPLEHPIEQSIEESEEDYLGDTIDTTMYELLLRQQAEMLASARSQQEEIERRQPQQLHSLGAMRSWGTELRVRSSRPQVPERDEIPEESFTPNIILE